MKRVVCITTVLFLLSGSAVFAAEPKKTKADAGSQKASIMTVEKKEAATATKTRKDMTDKELARYIAAMLESEDEVLDFVPGIKRQIDKNGKVTYSYKGMALENLDRKSLESLATRISNERLRIRTERINRQLERIGRVQQVTGGAGEAVRTPAAAPTPPRPPEMPTPPQSGPQIPKAPSPPPAPPRR